METDQGRCSLQVARDFCPFPLCDFLSCNLQSSGWEVNRVDHLVGGPAAWSCEPRPARLCASGNQVGVRSKSCMQWCEAFAHCPLCAHPHGALRGQDSQDRQKFLETRHWVPLLRERIHNSFCLLVSECIDWAQSQTAFKVRMLQKADRNACYDNTMHGFQNFFASN